MKNITFEELKSFFDAELSEEITRLEIEPARSQEFKVFCIQKIDEFRGFGEDVFSFIQSITNIEHLVKEFDTKQPGLFTDCLSRIKLKLAAKVFGLSEAFFHGLLQQTRTDDHEMVHLLDLALEGKKKTSTGQKIQDRLTAAYGSLDETVKALCALILGALRSRPIPGDAAFVKTFREARKKIEQQSGSQSLVQSMEDVKWSEVDIPRLRRLGIPERLKSDAALLEFIYMQPNQQFQKVMIECVGFLPEIPQFMICPIARMPFKDPVYISGDDGAKHVFEKEYITQVIMTRRALHPLTGLPLKPQQRTVHKHEEMSYVMKLYKKVLRMEVSSCYKAKDYAKSEAIYKQYLEFEPICVVTFGNIMVTMMHQAKYESVIAFYQEEVRQAEFHDVPALQAHFYAAQAHLLAKICESGWSAETQDKVQGAIALLEKALKVTEEPKLKDKKWRKCYETLHRSLSVRYAAHNVSMFAGAALEDSAKQSETKGAPDQSSLSRRCG